MSIRPDTTGGVGTDYLTPDLLRLYLGIDPGASGGIALLGEHFAEAHRMPETEADTRDLLEKYAPSIECAVIEAVHSMPAYFTDRKGERRQGIASTFKFGRNYGFLRGLLIALRIPFREVTPAAWQKVMQCRTGGDKNVSKARAQQLFPRLKITHATADALLIAEYARRTS